MVSNLENDPVVGLDFFHGRSIIRNFGSQLGESLPPRINWNDGFQHKEHRYQGVYEKEEVFHDNVGDARVLSSIEKRVCDKANEGQRIDNQWTPGRYE